MTRYTRLHADDGKPVAVSTDAIQTERLLQLTADVELAGLSHKALEDGIREAHAAGLSQADIAQAVGLTQQRISQIIQKGTP